MAIKVFGIEGEKLAGHDADTQDFVFATGPTFPSGTASGFLRDAKQIGAATPAPEGLKSTVSSLARNLNKVLNAIGTELPKADFFGHPYSHPLGDAYFSQAPVRYGDYVAKLAAFPASVAQDQLRDWQLDPHQDEDGFRHAAVDFFAENDQIAFGTGVLVDGLDFSDDKMLVGRTFSYSDTQRHRIGTNYLQVPVNQPHSKVATNQRDGAMATGVDHSGDNPHVNYEPSITGGLREATHPGHTAQGPVITGRLVREHLPRTNDYQQAGERFRLMEEWEQDDLVNNLVNLIGQAIPEVQQRMVWHFLIVEDELGLRLGEGLGITPDDVKHLAPLPTQTLTDDELKRIENLGANGPRNVDGLVFTGIVPNERHVVTRDGVPA